MTSEDPGVELDMGETYRDFLSDSEPHMRLAWHGDALPEVGEVSEVFDPDSFWKLEESKDSFVLEHFFPAFSRSRPAQITLLSKDFRTGDIHLHPACVPDARTVNPLADRLDELLYMHLLAEGLGASFHACCMDWCGSGLLFLGHSGAGKSTLARIFAEHCPEARVLSDDRAVVRPDPGDGYRIHGTPWHGTGAHALAGSAPLSAVYVIEHGERTVLEPIDGAGKLAEVLTRSLVPYWLRSATEFSVSFLDEMTRSVPCTRLSFTPDRGVIDLLETRN